MIAQQYNLRHNMYHEFYEGAKWTLFLMGVSAGSLWSSITKWLGGSEIGAIMSIITFILSTVLLYWTVVLRKGRAKERVLRNRKLELENEALERAAKREIEEHGRQD